MNVTIEDLCTITEDVLSTVIGLVPTACNTTPAATRPDQWLEGRIEIHGRWSGELAIACGPQLAATLASAFFGEPVSVDRFEDANSALLELANILAGHVNALMAAPSRITLPHLAGTSPATSEPVGGRPPELIAAYSCGDQDLLVTLRETSARGGGGA